MFQKGDTCFWTYTPSIQRDPLPGEGIDYIFEKGDPVIVEGEITDLSKFYIPVQLYNGSIRQKLYPDLTFHNGIITFQELEPYRKEAYPTKELFDSNPEKYSFMDWIDYPPDHRQEICYFPRETITVEGILPWSFRDLHIPVLDLDGKNYQIPYQELYF